MTIKTSEVKVIRRDDLDNIVTKVYGRRYNFQQQDGCKSRGG